MKKIIFALISLTLLVTSCQESKKEKFEREAKELTKECPITYSPYVQLDSMVYLPERNINKYYYTVSGQMDNEKAIRDSEKDIVGEVSNSVELKEYKDFNTSIEYIYRSAQNGQILYKVMVTPEEYK